MPAAPAELLAKRLRKQAVPCRALGSPLYGYLLDRAADDVEAGGPVLDALRDHAFLPSGAAIALRFMGAVHRLVLEGAAPELARFYPSAGGDASDQSGAWEAFRALVEERRAEIAPLLDRSVQTNEVGRSAALLGGFLEVSRRSGLPLRVLEIGASAGLNLRWDHFRYAAEEGTWGPAGSPVRLDGFAPAPDMSVAAEVEEREGCDPDPVDPATEEGRLTLSTYVWPDQTERWARLQGALDIAARVPAPVALEGAGTWLSARLAETRAGVATVVFHSIMWQYMPSDEQRQVREALVAAGGSASDDAPVAWLRMEPPVTAAPDSTPAGVAPEPDFTKIDFRAEDLADVHLTLWPGGESRLVAKAGYHGRPVVWRGFEA